VVEEMGVLFGISIDTTARLADDGWVRKVLGERVIEGGKGTGTRSAG
jgi:hypothetical protein